MSGAVDNPQAWGWCPSVLRPMPLEDGLMLRIRAPMGRLTRDQAAGLAHLAGQYGAGVIELTNRANLQLRGLTAEEHAELLPKLDQLGLTEIDRTPSGRVNIALNPLYKTGDRQHRLAQALSQALAEARYAALPQKFGFVIDAGDTRIMAETPADIRLEGAGGRLLVRAQGGATGRAFDTVDGAITHAMALADWFLASGGKAADGRGRMATHLQTTPLPAALAGDSLPNPAQDYTPSGSAWLSTADGRLEPGALAAALDPRVTELRLSPFRALYLPDLDARAVLP